MDLLPSTWMRAAIVVILAAMLVALTPFADVYGSSRPDAIPATADGVRWPAPESVTDHVATPMVHRSRDMPLRLPGVEPVLELHVEQEVVDRYGIETVEEAAARWSGTEGSPLEVRIAGVVDDGVDRNVYDGVNRVFVNRDACERPRLGGAFVRIGDVDERFGPPMGHVAEVNIGLCPHLPPAQATALLVHEIGHGLGFGHLCDPDDPHGCWEEAMGEGNRCRPMYAAITACQRWEDEDDHAVVRRYPTVPAIRGDSLADTAARVAHTLVPATWDHDTVVVVDGDAPDDLRWSAVALAGALRAPLLVAPDDPRGCIDGEFARELGRVASFGAEALLVGDAAVRCGPEAERWEISGLILRDAEAVAQAAVARLGSDGVVVVGADAEGEVVFGAAAAVAAGHLRAPLLVAAEGRLDEAALGRMADDAPRWALTLGDRSRAPTGRAAAQLRATVGAEVDHLLAAEPTAARRAVADHLPTLREGRLLFVAEGSDDALIAAAYAPLWGADLVPIAGDHAGSVGGLAVSGRVSQALIVGDGLGEAAAIRISRAVDTAASD